MSRRLTLFNVASRAVVKPLLRRQTKDVEQARRGFARMSRLLTRPPPFTVALPQDDPRGEWIWSRKTKPGGVILYLHGGGYILGSPKTHRAMVARLSRLSGVRAFVPDYRLAPEHRFPAALEDAQTAWQMLLTAGYHPGDIVIGGDSAGGGLALALLSVLCQSGTPPRAVFAFSPWTDLTLSGASLQENAKNDVFFPAARVAELRDMYVSEQHARDPRASPLFGAFPNCPPVLLHCSQTELLRDDTLRMADRLRRFGGQVTVRSLPRRPHVWQMFDRLLPEAKDALREAGAFIEAALHAPRSNDS